MKALYFTSLLCIVSFCGNVTAAPSNSATRIRSKIDEIAQWDRNDKRPIELVASNYFDAPWESFNVAASNYFTIKNNIDVRGELFLMVRDLAAETQRRKLVPDSEWNVTVGNFMGQVIAKDYYSANSASRIMRSLPPEIIQAHRVDIEAGAFEVCAVGAIQLYGEFKDADMKKVRASLEKYRPKASREPARVSTYALNVVLARHGEKEAEDWLLGQIANVNNGESAMMNVIVDALVEVGSERIIAAAARGLECEDLVHEPGGMEIPRRFYYSYVLSRCVGNRQGFPSTPVDSQITISNMLRWAESNLGMTNSGKPFKPVYGITGRPI